MLLLFETAAGFALFKVLNEGKLEQAEVRCATFSTHRSAQLNLSRASWRIAVFCLLQDLWKDFTTLDELRLRGFDARLDRESTLALPAVGHVAALRISIWLDDIVIHRAPANVTATTRAHLWARGPDGEPRWEDDRQLRAREDRAPFDVLQALGRDLAKQIAAKAARR